MNESKLINKTFYRQQVKFQKNRLADVTQTRLHATIDPLTNATILIISQNRSSTSFLTANAVADWQKLLGLTVLVLRFFRCYPTLFHKFLHPRWPSLLH
ncbi:hypothetical protein Fmac_007555 [Flemingia macrophylla]|uniref:PORR domain-containing protein n=1 Tax=Flemingia macrophylla TaxID=520843 RepID=A0ABD1MUW1_9FABA